MTTYKQNLWHVQSHVQKVAHLSEETHKFILRALRGKQTKLTLTDYYFNIECYSFCFLEITSNSKSFKNTFWRSTLVKIILTKNEIVFRKPINLNTIIEE